jgi:uracil-DNA glycosylase family 4
VLAREYFRQLGEAGETEIYLPRNRATMVTETQQRGARAATAPGRAPETSPAAEAAPPHTAPGPEKAPTSRPAPRRVPSAVSAAAAPEVEIVHVKLAFSQETATRDMFAAAGGLESCATLDEVEAAAAGCVKCELSRGRTNIVFGVGDSNARLLFVGEAPGRDEDIQGIPFVGRAGQLLNKILEAAGIARNDVYIANIIKCRPPNNRTPFTDEIESCIPYLGRQVALIAPKIICTLGLPATQTLLGIRGSMGSLRGKVYVDGDVKVIPTYHPAAALRDPKYKRPIWDDFLLIKREYERT